MTITLVVNRQDDEYSKFESPDLGTTSRTTSVGHALLDSGVDWSTAMVIKAKRSSARLWTLSTEVDRFLATTNQTIDPQVLRTLAKDKSKAAASSGKTHSTKKSLKSRALVRPGTASRWTHRPQWPSRYVATL